MKIAMIIISNRPNDLKLFLESMKIMEPIRNNFEVCCLLQPPFTGYENFLVMADKIKLVDSVSPPVPFVYLRKQAMLMAPDCDYFWSLDDDHRFSNSGGETFTKTCADYYDDVFKFLANNPKVGVLTCRGYVGGYSWGYSFKYNPVNGILATDKGGIFFKNIGIDSIIEPEEEQLVGALFESLAGYNILNFNYLNSRRYNSPIKNRPPGAAKHIGGSKNLSYCDEVVGSNIEKRIREKFDDPKWTHSSKKYPKAIAKKMGV